MLISGNLLDRRSNARHLCRRELRRTSPSTETGHFAQLINRKLQTIHEDVIWGHSDETYHDRTENEIYARENIIRMNTGPALNRMCVDVSV